MSGRLVILRHKTWNVWNVEARNKVLKDERKHREEEEAKEKRSKELMNEQTLTILKLEAVATADTSDTGANAEPVEVQVATRFSLFDDPSCPVLTVSGRQALGNSEYIKEAEDKKTKELRANNMAPWGFSEVTSGLQPWYAGGGDEKRMAGGRVQVRGREVAGPEADMARLRDDCRKGKLTLSFN